MKHLFHQWTKWGETWVKVTRYTWDVKGDMGTKRERYQDKECTVCGKRKSRRVR